MLYSIASSILVLIALLIGLGAVWIVIRRSWFMAWLKGSLALCVLGAAVMMTLVAVDLFQFRSFQKDTPVAKVSLKRLDQQKYRLTLSIPEKAEQEFEIAGDLWQLDARLITWSGPFAMAGMEPGYRLDRVSGRYYSLEQETNAARTVYEVEHISTGIDFWEWVQSRESLPWVKARYGSATYLPMKDGAEFSVAVGIDGLIAKPINSPAVEAVQNWK